MMEENGTSARRYGLHRIISVVFHPLLIPLYGLLVVFTAPTFFRYLPLRFKEIIFLIVLVNNVLIPVSLIPFFRYKSIISSRINEDRRERVIPLITVTILYSVTSFIMYRLPIAVFLKAYFYSLTLVAVTLLVVNLWWKISVYSAGAGILAALTIALSIKLSAGIPYTLIIIILVSGAILSSRLKMNSHSPAEVYTGFAAGFLIPGLLMMIIK